MEGKNSITLNPATIKEAMQEWCDRHLKDSVAVHDIDLEKQTSLKMTVGFEACEEKDEALHTLRCLEHDTNACVCGPS